MYILYVYVLLLLFGSFQTDEPTDVECGACLVDARASEVYLQQHDVCVCV